jgi:hypothetical protein
MPSTRTLVASIEGEFRRYKALADAAMAQLSETELAAAGPGGGNSVVVIAWHIGGNLASRFTDFLATDGEKARRKRDEEFLPRTPSREELQAHWEKGWRILFASLAELDDSNLQATVVIRGAELPVHDALHRSLGHVSYHVGQIVYVAKALRGADWEWLSIPPGQSSAYNRNPERERAGAQAAELERRTRRP